MPATRSRHLKIKSDTKGAPGRKPEGGEHVQFRLPPWLIVHFQLKCQQQNDSAAIKEALLKAIDYIKARPNDPISQLEATDGKKYRFQSKIGWTERITFFNVRMNRDYLLKLKRFAKAGEWREIPVSRFPQNKYGSPGSPTSAMIRRLMTVAAAIDGKTEEGGAIVSYREYRLGRSGDN